MTDEEILYRALSQWINHIETGDITLSSNDLINMAKREKLKKLTKEQYNFIRRLREIQSDL